MTGIIVFQIEILYNDDENLRNNDGLSWIDSLHIHSCRFACLWLVLVLSLLFSFSSPARNRGCSGTGHRGDWGFGGLDVPPVFSCFQGQEEELCLTILQVRQVFGARGHQARTFVPKTSK